MECLNCQKEIAQTKGKRQKQFCSDNCRAVYWQKKNKGKEPKFVQFKTFKALKEKLDALSGKINFVETTPESYDAKKLDITTNDEVEIFPKTELAKDITAHNIEIWKKINAIREQEKPKWVHASDWNAKNRKLEEELKKQLKK